MKIKYENIIFRTKAAALIVKVNKIIEDYQSQGYSMTLRQLYYQLVAHDLFPDDQKFSLVNNKWVRDPDGTKNAQPNYDWLGTVVSNGRRAGLIDWDAIVDRTRYLRGWGRTHETVAEAVATAHEEFRVNPWMYQDSYVEVWFEKDALLDVFERASAPRRIPMMSCRGYGSDSTWHETANRLKAMNKRTVILYFGDHDPSGLDMTRDIEDRLNLFGAHPVIKRLALNMDQVRKYNPPPNWAKETDSRFAAYQAEFGDESWELDALSPDIMVKIVEKEIGKHLDLGQWDFDIDRENEYRAQLHKTSRHWSKLEKVLKQKRFNK